MRDVVASLGGRERKAEELKSYEGSGALASSELKELYDLLAQVDRDLIRRHTEDISLFDGFILIELGARGRDHFTEIIAIEPLPAGGFRIDVRERKSWNEHVRATCKDIAGAYSVILFIELAISEYLAATEVQDPSEPQSDSKPDRA